MVDEESQGQSYTYQELLEQNEALRRELEQLRTQNLSVWNILVETSRRLQLATASIKAAVSSLLNYDIFWDGANQHEFLQTINLSVDQTANLITLMSLSFRSEAGRLELNLEPQALPEIISLVEEDGSTKFLQLDMQISLPNEGKPVLVDYEYLKNALVLLLEVVASSQGSGQILISAEEGPQYWSLDFAGLDPDIVRIIHQMHSCKTDTRAFSHLLPENILRLHTACEILHLQNIEVETVDDPEAGLILRLLVPVL